MATTQIMVSPQVNTFVDRAHKTLLGHSSAKSYFFVLFDDFFDNILLGASFSVDNMSGGSFGVGGGMGSMGSMGSGGSAGSCPAVFLNRACWWECLQRKLFVS